ncbi:ABC transporter permease subunit [Campylobacter sp. MIT 97-5078]|uniref:ABC transporter permease subunit n=1 Tax=Campylobacter sp. MIT 97-5078 TaxID=1548153 RepID=UPI00051337A7|nr:ABC transporter permease subunit [Campylobacter sp. MIT 97-5078]KGI56066.1 nickel transporter permease NikB [Campylobacter sp. MIT 97-5078]TQR27720.1 nickel ABC transporter permease subunit NikB [Campylobacter sp. MIT 97-5078]
MLKFILKRLLYVPLILLLVSFVVFALLRLSPIDPAFSYLVQSQIPPTDEALNTARIELGLNKPFLEQYALWLKNALSLDFGISYVTKREVLGDLLYYLPTTLCLTLLSMLFLICVSIPLGIIAALKKNSLFDKCILLFSFAGVSIPSFWFGFLLILIFTLGFGVLSPFSELGFTRYILPVLTLSLMSLCINVRLMRASFLARLKAPFLLYARARGLSEAKIARTHLLKNSLVPVSTSLGMHFGELLGGAVVVEILFALPGLGRYAVGAIYSHDYPVVQCFVLLVTFVFIVMNLFIDILYVYLNPKIAYED